MRPRPDRWRYRKLLAPAAGLYGLVVRARNRRYDRRPGAVHSAPIPVISIGNITAGGTGKTPLVIETVRLLLDLGRRPAILTRGYAATAGQVPDEAQEFHAAHPDVPVIINPRRVAGAATAAAEHHADCAVLDDAFQHRRLARQLDVVVIDALDPWGGDRLLPVGNLREPLTNLRRAGLIVISRTNQADPAALADITNRLANLAPHAPTVRATVTPAAVAHADGRTEPPETLRPVRVQPVCGIGSPLTFVHALDSVCDCVRTVLRFPDHHHYTAHDANAVATAAQLRNCDLVVTTRKDWGKLLPVWPREPGRPPLARLDIRTQLDDPRGAYAAALRKAVESAP